MPRILPAIAPVLLIALGSGSIAIPTPAAAQATTTPTATFLKAVDARDGTTVTAMLISGGAQMANVHGGDREETALHVVARRRDALWARFLIGQGANPDVLDKASHSPLMIAIFNDDINMARTLLDDGAAADFSNARGETPLILAVQQRKSALIRLLVAHGADPDRADFVAGLSARDYATRDARSASLVDALEKKDPGADAKTLPIGPVFKPRG